MPSSRPLFPPPRLLTSPIPLHAPLCRSLRSSILIGHRCRKLDGPPRPRSPRHDSQTLSLRRSTRLLSRMEASCLTAKPPRCRSRFLRCTPRRCPRFQINTARRRSRSRLSSRFRASILIFPTPPNRPNQLQFPMESSLEAA